MDKHLQKIEIKNFRTHKHSLLEFVPGINIITGMPDCGKTNWLRALDFLRSNRPSGDRFKHNRDPSLTVSVEASFMDGCKVRHDKKKSSSYAVVDEDGQEVTYGKVGTNVPDNAIEVLGLSDVNIQGQFSQPYLLWMTGGEMAKLFNSLSGMDEYDNWQASLDSEARAVSKELKQIYQDLESNTAARERLEPLSRADSEAKLAKKLEVDIDQLTEEAHFLLDALDSLEKSEQAIKKYDKLSDAEAAMESAGFEEKLLVTLSEEKKWLSQWESSLSECLALDEYLSPIQQEIEAASSAAQKIAELIQEKKLMDVFKKEARACNEAVQEHMKLAKQYGEAICELGICDQCFSEIDRTTAERIAAKLAAM